MSTDPYEVGVVLLDEGGEDAVHFRLAHAFLQAHVCPARVPHPIAGLDVLPEQPDGAETGQSFERDVRVAGDLAQDARHLHVQGVVPLHHLPHRVLVAEVLFRQCLREHDAARFRQRGLRVADEQGIVEQIEHRAVHQIRGHFR